MKVNEILREAVSQIVNSHKYVGQYNLLGLKTLDRHTSCSSVCRMAVEVRYFLVEMVPVVFLTCLYINQKSLHVSKLWLSNLKCNISKCSNMLKWNVVPGKTFQKDFWKPDQFLNIFLLFSLHVTKGVWKLLREWRGSWEKTHKYEFNFIAG